MLTIEEKNLVAVLSESMDVPPAFVELIIESEKPVFDLSFREKLVFYKQRANFITAMLSMSSQLSQPLPSPFEFYAQNLSSDTGFPMELCRSVVTIERDDPIPEERQISIRKQRAETFMKLFHFIVQHPICQEVLSRF